jgi:YesN/AraC family two-component response regulator
MDFSLFSSKNLLIVDDEIAPRDHIEKLVGDQFNKVSLSGDAERAINLLEEKHFDVIISDVHMPGMDGLSLMGKIRWNHPDIVIIIMSGHGDTASMRKHIESHGYEFLSKPFNKDQLIYTLYNAIKKKESGQDDADQSAISSESLDDFSDENKEMIEWLSKLEILIEYRIANPTKWPTSREIWKNCRIGSWVHKQRREYKKFRLREESSLTEERVQKLRKINFIWDSKHSRWLEKFDAIKQFRIKNKDKWPIASGEDKELGDWCTYQRSEYRKFMSGKPSSLSKRKIELLNKIGFGWGE